MENMCDCYAIILHHPELRRGLIRDASSSGRSDPGANTSHVLRRWFAHAFHGLATRVDPASHTVGLTPAPASQELAQVGWHVTTAAGGS